MIGGHTSNGLNYLLNATTKAQVVPTLLTLIGKNTYKILRDLCTPIKLEEKIFEEIRDCLQDYFEPKLYFISERVKFNIRVQSKKMNQSTLKRSKDYQVIANLVKG